MKVSATDMKNYFGRYLKKCEDEDIYITRNDRIIAKLSFFPGPAEGHLIIKEGNAAYGYSKKITYEEFLKLTEDNEKRYEFIDGEVYLLASPGLLHQLIHSNLYAKLISYFKNQACRVISAPFDITLLNEETGSKNVVQPDLMIICDHDKSTDKNDRYMGVPSMVVEIISPQTRNRDLVKKLNLYLEGGVSEYWIVDPEEKKVIQYYFLEKQLERIKMYEASEIVKAVCFKGLDIIVEDIFR